MVRDGGPVGLGGVRVVFDDEGVVSDAGVALVAMVAQRLGVEALAGSLVRLRRDRPGAADAGRKVMALLFSMVLGADSIDGCDVLRAGCTRRLLGGWVPAPSMLGTFLRAFTFGHVRQLDALLGQALERAWQAAAGPGAGRLVIDVGSFVGEGCGRLEQGAAYGYTQLFGYHPLLARRADTRAALQIRLRRGSANTQKGIVRFTDELIARVTRAGAVSSCCAPTPGSGTRRSSSASNEPAGQYSIGVRKYSIGVRVIKAVRAAVEAIDEDAGGTSRSSPSAPRSSRWSRPSIAITPSSNRSSPTSKTRRWRTSPPATSTPTQPGRCSGRWRTTCSDGPSCSGCPTRPCAPRALRRRLLAVPGRLTRHARGWTLHLPARWPWHCDYISALTRTRALPAAA